MRYRESNARIENDEALDDEIEAFTRDRDVAELEAMLQAVDVPAHRVSTSRGAAEDPQLIAREHFIPLEHPEIGSGDYENARVRLSATPGRPRPCPTLGQHDATIPGEPLGYSEEEITDLVTASAIE